MRINFGAFKSFNRFAQFKPSNGVFLFRDVS
jgi:hypothetical protein